MRLTESRPDIIEFRGRRPARAPIWVGLALFLGPFSLSVFGPAPFSALHAFGTVALGSLATVLIAVGFPRERWVRIRTKERTVESNDQGAGALGASPVARLVSVWTRGSSGNAHYGISLDRVGAPPILLVATDDPHVALADLGRLRSVLPLHVVGGWGLPADAPFVDEAPLSTPGERPAAPWDDRSVRRPFVLTLIIATTGIAFALSLEVRERLLLGDEVRTPSIALPIGMIAMLALLTAVIATHRTDLSLGSELALERRLLGIRYAKETLAPTRIRAAYLVSPSGHRARHLLLDTADGPLAFPCDDAAGERVVRELTAAVR